MERIFMKKNAESLKEILNNEKNIILRGAPGTGKSYLSKDIAALLVDGKKYADLGSEEKNRIGFVQFHPSYDYTDFVEGLKPTISDSGEMRFELKDGIFKSFVNRAKNDSNNNYVFIIDEINRGEISKIFGELFFSIDPGYRGKAGEVSTQYSSLGSKNVEYVVYTAGESKKLVTWYNNKFETDLEEKFFIPDNVYIVGTMNDIDRSVDTFDFAMRRRFSFIEVTAADSAENMKIAEKNSEAYSRMRRLNHAILSIESLGTDYQIGGAYFYNVGTSKEDFDNLWKNKLEPLLKDYLRGEVDENANLQILRRAYGYNN